MKKYVVALFFLLTFFIGSTQNKNWNPLFETDLSNAIFAEGVWSFEDGILTATEDECIWSVDDYENFMLEFEFKNSVGTNSGLIVYCTNWRNWIHISVAIQIADDFAEQWANADKTWKCGAIFGHLAATESRVKKPGEWNKMKITCKGKNIQVELNGKIVTEMDMALWTSATINPDGTEIPSWLNTPFSQLPTHGKIGFQGKHAGAPIWFRNIKVKEM